VPGAGDEQRLLVGEIAIDGRASYARVVGDRADRGARRAQRAVQLRGALRVQLRPRRAGRRAAGRRGGRGRSRHLIFKPRGQWHTFWNAGDEPARILEIISPAGFEGFFDELVELGGVTQADPEVLGALCARYELEMDPHSVPGLVDRFGLRFPGEPI
jgi:hypothetical protein